MNTQAERSRRLRASQHASPWGSAIKQLTLSDVPSVHCHKLFCAWDPHEGILLIVLQRTQAVRTPKDCLMLGASGVYKTPVPKATTEIL